MRRSPLILLFLAVVIAFVGKPSSVDGEDAHPQPIVSTAVSELRVPSASDEAQLVHRFQIEARNHKLLVDTAAMQAAAAAQHEREAKAARDREAQRQRELTAQRASTTTRTAANANTSRTYAPGVEQWRGEVSKYPWPVDTMLAIMRCESGGDPNNWFNKAGGRPWSKNTASGLFMLLTPPDGWENPVFNIRYAYENKYVPALKQGDGLGPWRASASCW